MKAGRIVMLVLGCLIALIGLVMFIGGGVGIIVYATQRDDDGFFRTDDIELMSPTAAITSENLDLNGAKDADWITERGDFATVTLDVRPVGEAGPVFVGIGPTDDVTAYLERVGYDELADFDIDDAGDDVRYERIDGDRTPTPPGEETFWAAQSTGDAPLTWDVEGGDWTVVVMNADGSSGIDVVAHAGIKLDWLLPLAIAVCVLGYLLLAGGVVLAVFGARGSRSTSPTVQTTPGAATSPPPTAPPPATDVPPAAPPTPPPPATDVRPTEPPTSPPPSPPPPPPPNP